MFVGKGGVVTGDESRKQRTGYLLGAVSKRKTSVIEATVVEQVSLC